VTEIIKNLGSKTIALTILAQNLRWQRESSAALFSRKTERQIYSSQSRQNKAT